MMIRYWFLFLWLPLASAAWSAPPIGDDALGALRGLETSPERPAPFENGFIAREGDTVVFLGGTQVVLEQFSGIPETALTLAWPEKNLRFRYMAWQADTVYRQQRPLYFFDREHQDKQPGSTQDRRKRVQADVIVARFGKMESLDGEEALPAFRATYEKLLDELTTLTPRLVLMAPTPFFQTGPASHLAAERNRVLAAYCDVIRGLAKERGLIFVDLFQIEPDSPYSANGVHLNEAGQRKAALLLTQQLSQRKPEVDFQDEQVEKLRQTIVRKNEIWHQYHRPTNWAFLYGDRQHVPSSRDHEDSEKRWFSYEIERALPLISNLEEEIHELAK